MPPNSLVQSRFKMSQLRLYKRPLFLAVCLLLTFLMLRPGNYTDPPEPEVSKLRPPKPEPPKPEPPKPADLSKPKPPKPETPKLETLVPSPSTLGVFSKIYVVSLPYRTDRRKTLEWLRNALKLEWTYFSAISSESEIVFAIMQRLKTFREECLAKDCARASSFFKQDDVDRLAISNTSIPLTLFSSDFLDPADIPDLSRTWLEYPESPIPCARGNFTFPNDKQGKPACLLTPGRVACWHSHLSVIQKIANDQRLGPTGAALVLEDDVDMESDIHAQLEYLWPSLPQDWDMVFLGHCWSDEARSPPISKPNPSNPTFSLLHPSREPLCLHAYALSRKGARRLLSYLRYAPFAYSREVDQALAEIIRRRMLKAYSLVPSIVAQRKVTNSDLSPGIGSSWKDKLRRGVLDNLLDSGKRG